MFAYLFRCLQIVRVPISIGDFVLQVEEVMIVFHCDLILFPEEIVIILFHPDDLNLSFDTKLNT